MDNNMFHSSFYTFYIFHSHMKAKCVGRCQMFGNRAHPGRTNRKESAGRWYKIFPPSEVSNFMTSVLDSYLLTRTCFSKPCHATHR
eukprot:g19332.t1